MKQALASLFSSKKFLSTVGGIIATLAVNVVGLDPAVADKLSTGILGLTAVLVGGFGAADFGKEKAKVEKGQA